ncbi:MAG: bifunctional folylpolyglutamate synthase/dihydrofolate synthase [Cyclobacteriaceae bacterium]|nr:bifunctional folylpolyglutamate synthase/dihydrofolate synthase [Cyclobacteriaceae bacterium]MCH8516999.1 bifunctional folylpolyglutamate synthase/dihydrofolate synthase [Cyclobacteriaceae bacterium]
MKSYQEAVDYLFKRLPMFQRSGGAAYKSGLGNAWALSEALGAPQNKFKSIHIAGTNGKGSTSHILAACLQSLGLKVGLYTSPHLRSFTERMRINGQPISQDKVLTYVNHFQPIIEQMDASFFEVTTFMAFQYFADEQVDIAVVETGMGGRLDTTNVIDPLACIITNIGSDHAQFLGDTPQKIAREKAGIIKPSRPVYIGKLQEETVDVFRSTAEIKNAPIKWAQDCITIDGNSDCWELTTDRLKFKFTPDLKGPHQLENYRSALSLLCSEPIFTPMNLERLKHGLENVAVLSGLRGRWQKLGSHPTIIADTGHNEEAIKLNMAHLPKAEIKHFVLGFVTDKDVKKMIALFPREGAWFYFCTPQVPRGMSISQIADITAELKLNASFHPSVTDAYLTAKSKANTQDLIYVGGSTFVVAEIDEINDANVALSY